ncbi:MAG: alanine--tRNA ligase [Candidatus Taylorbacteria bacterium]
MQPITSAEIRSRFLEFFKKRGHAIIPSASLITSDEKGVTNSTLFNTAGMQPLVPYILGKPHPLGTRLVDAQKCLRTIDIDDVGDRTHATFFEMLGNWSLGDYFKKEAIAWSYEFLTSKSTTVGDRGLGLDPNRLYVTVFEGDSIAPRDEEAADIWRDIFAQNKIDPNRIFYLPAKNNWWEAGDNGPCGPDTEMYYDVKNTFGGKPITHEQFLKADESRDVVEVWNDVFMQYEKKDGKIIGQLPKPSVDTGAGLERLTITMQGVDNIYDTDLFKTVMALLKANSKNYDVRSARIITEHIRSSTFLIGDGVTPSNTDRGYILRRLLRRAIRYAKLINTSVRLNEIVDVYAEMYKDIYPNILAQKEQIKTEIRTEAEKFEKTLEIGIKEFNKIAGSNAANISGTDAFILFSSYGFPIDMTVDLAKEKGLTVDVAAFNTEFKKHQDLSRAGAEQKFKGGLAKADDGHADPMVIRYHTATHLLHQALRDVLGDSVSQKGSNITAERLRFDFAHGAKMTDDEKKRVEDIVNEKIAAKMSFNKVLLPKAEAEKTGALHFFGEKYGDEISVYYTGDDLSHAYSKEFCGGPHVTNTGDLAGPEGKWKFKIQKEEAVAQGIRRIKAVLG